MKKYREHLVSILVVVIVPIIFLLPQFKGDMVNAGDAISSISWSKHITDYDEETGIHSKWNPSQFSGHPSGLLGVGHRANLIYYLNKATYLFLSYPMGYFVKSSLLTFIILLMLGFRPILACIFSLLFSLNLNHIVLLSAGHGNKIDVIITFPLIIGAILLIINKKRFQGFAILALGISIAILRNHIQMVYYFMLAIAMFGLIYCLIEAIGKRNIRDLAMLIVIIVFAGLIGASSNYSKLYASASFSQETMRGKPILEKKNSAKGEITSSSSEVDGLNWSYAMRWSSDLKELISVIIPRSVGGSSHEKISKETSTGKLLRQNKTRKTKTGQYNAPMYWGSMPFTSGPYYLGISLVFLYIFSFYVIENKYKWAFLGAFVILILLSFGKNAYWFNRSLFDGNLLFFTDGLPLFNKFRAPNSVMNILASFLIFPAIMSIDKVLKTKNKDVYVKPLLMSVGILGGLCAVYWLFGGYLFSFSGPSDSSYQSQITNIFIDTRKELLRSDALRSLIFIIVFAAIIWFYLKGKFKNKIMFVSVLGIIALIDIWTVNSRYLGADEWISKNKFHAQFNPRVVDNQILKNEPKGRGYYRVLDLSINTFNSSHTSYHHNTIGGYSAIKPQRYQDLIDYHISKGNRKVLNMLNTKYIISKNQTLQLNDQALGNAWFVKEILPAKTSNEEIEFMNNSNFIPKENAIIMVDSFRHVLNDFEGGTGLGSIELTNYAPNKMIYNSKSNSEQLAVFSEMWYGPNKGWEAKLDGVPIEIIRVNYALRSLKIPAGKHEIVFTFKPKAELIGLSYASSSIILLLLIITLVSYLKQIRFLKKIT